MSARNWSDLTVTDVFCGAGGNTIGAKKAGLRVRVGLNHWQRAIDTYGTNNPEVDVVERVDVSLCDPRRYPSTDIAVMSPECTTHSPAGGNKHRRGDGQPSLFGTPALDPATVRSRVTMFDVVRFTEFHRYRLVIAENVVEATRWELFPDWLHMMTRLGYAHRILSLNSMFFHPTPQSRDRIYIVFWQTGNPAPNLDYRPPAPCARCGVVEAVQVWKNGRTIGKYRRQYIYACPRCAREVTPFYYAALNALDFSLAAERIGERKRPLMPRTMERIAFGLEKYGRRTLVVQTNMTSRLASRVRSAVDDPMPTQPASVHHAMVTPAPFLVACANGGGDARRVVGADDPLRTIHAGGGNHELVQSGFLVETAHTHRNSGRPRGLDEPMPTLGAQLTSALVSPFIISAGSRESAAAGTDPMPTQTGSERLGVVSPFLVKLRGTEVSHVEASASGVDEPIDTVCASTNHFGFIVTNRENNTAKGLDEPLSPACTGNHHAVIQGAAQLSMRDVDAMRVAGLERELMTQGGSPQQAIIARAPYLVGYYGTNNVSPADEPVPTVTSIDKHGLVDPTAELRVEDCYFRMLQPHEIGAAMAFPGDYIVGGNKRDRVKQYGNAVTPPVMDWIVRQCAATLAPELEEGAA